MIQAQNFKLVNTYTHITYPYVTRVFESLMFPLQNSVFKSLSTLFSEGVCSREVLDYYSTF